ncbi:hypothetical protein ACSBR1_025912 [Camellia fascicularis]
MKSQSPRGDKAIEPDNFEGELEQQFKGSIRNIEYLINVHAIRVLQWVLLILQIHDTERKKLKKNQDIYSSESASWKQIEFSEPLGVEGVFWNGAIHWLSDGVDFHCRFEVDTEKLIKPPCPARPKILSVDKFRSLASCSDAILLCYEIQNPSDGKGLLEGVNKNDFSLVLGIRGKFIYYNLKCKTLKVLCDSLPQGGRLDLILNPSPYYRTNQFVESISPV